MGTEGRRDGVKEIAASDTITGLVKFKVDLIKDIKIIKGPEENEVPEDDEDPAIVASKEPKQIGTVNEPLAKKESSPIKEKEETQPDKARRQLEKFSLEDAEEDSKVDGEMGFNRFQRRG